MLGRFLTDAVLAGSLAASAQQEPRPRAIAPDTQTRFTLDFTDGKWREIGEFSRDGGQNWMKNFEMTLSRAK